MVSFIDREYELSVLEEAWGQDGAKLVVLYGRRRVGKTKLVTEFLKGRDGLFFIAEDVGKKVQIRGLKDALAGFLNDDFLRKTEISEWGDLFLYLAKVLPKEKRLYLAIDEFSYLIKNDPAIVSAMQKFWDVFLSNSRIFLIVSGSIFGLMSENVLSSSSPLYGRRSRDLLVRPMPFQHAAKFLRMPFADKLEVYMATGGVPEYLLKAAGYGNSESFLAAEFMRKDGYFYREPYFLLSQEFKEIKTYFTILNAISYGNTRPAEIANFSGLKGREVYPYLENLIALGFVERTSPVVGGKKGGIYLIRDVFFDFWFNFVFPNRERIERDEAVRPDMRPYFGKRFEMAVRNEFFHKLLNFERSGRWWHQEKEIDVVALNEGSKEIVFCECKWQDRVDAHKVLQDLKEKSKFVLWNNEDRKEQYALFAKSFKRKISEPGLHLFDLKDLERALSRPAAK